MAAWGQRASTAKMKECIGEVLQEMLKDHTYKQDEAPELTKQIADRVKKAPLRS